MRKDVWKGGAVPEQLLPSATFGDNRHCWLSGTGTFSSAARHLPFSACTTPLPFPSQARGDTPGTCPPSRWHGPARRVLQAAQQGPALLGKAQLSWGLVSGPLGLSDLPAALSSSTDCSPG